MRARSPWRARRTDRPLVFAHRGCPREATENTLASFEAAGRSGADGIELDVRVCRSGEVIVMHDPTLARLTNGLDERAIAELDYDEIRRVDLGGGEAAPTLHDVLAFARPRRLVVNIEMKRDVPDRARVAAATASSLRTWDPAHPVLVSSFDPAMLAAFHLLAPSVPTGLLVHRTSYWRLACRVAPFTGAAGVHIERTIASPALVRSIRRRGLAVCVWTVNAVREALDLAALGVDAVITDVPGEIRAVLE